MLDAALIACGQAIEHYEIARYGAMVAWAKGNGQHEVAGLLQQTLDEEKANDQLMNEIAERAVNQGARNVDEVDEGDDEKDESPSTEEPAPKKPAAKAKKPTSPKAAAKAAGKPAAPAPAAPKPAAKRSAKK